MNFFNLFKRAFWRKKDDATDGIIASLTYIVDKDNTIYVYYPNMANEEDVIRSILHEFEHAHQDPKEYEKYRKQGYDGQSNPLEVAARDAEEKWKNYLVDSAGEPQ